MKPCTLRPCSRITATGDVSARSLDTLAGVRGASTET